MPQLPFPFGIKFDDPTYHTSVSDERVQLTIATVFTYVPSYIDTINMTEYAIPTIAVDETISLQEQSSEVVTIPIPFPFKFGSRFGVRGQYSRTSYEEINVTEKASYQLHLYPTTVFKTYDKSNVGISTSSEDTFGLRTDVHYTIVFITDEVKLSEESLTQLVIDTLTKLGLKSTQTLGLEQTLQDDIELQSLQTISLDQSPKDTLKIDEYSYHISKELISQEQRQVLTLRQSDTLLIVFTKPITYYNITEVYCVLETQDHEVTIRRHGLLFDDSIIFIDRINLQSGMYRGWFELMLDTGDVVTVPESGREFVVIVG